MVHLFCHPTVTAPMYPNTISRAYCKNHVAVKENEEMFAKVHVRCEEIRKQWYTGIEEESDETALLKRRAKL